MYLSKVPYIVQQLYPRYIWRFPSKEKQLFLSFDDGPSPKITEWVLDLLKKHDAKATFFLIGDRVIKHPGIVHKIIDEGHSIGNHTQNHLRGRKTETKKYLKNFLLAQRSITDYSGFRTDLFRPPYGSISTVEADKILQTHRIIMMDVISGDFDQKRSPETCAQKVIQHARPGSIILFHDTEKAFPRLEFALPKILDHFGKEGYSFQLIPANPPLMKIEREIL